mgnify:CR=1 FL=1|jgi:hypothetical protein
MAKIKNMGTSTMKFGEGLIITGSYVDDDTSLTVSGSIKIGLGANDYTLPITDGSADQYIKTDGNGTLAWSAISGGSGGVTKVTYLGYVSLQTTARVVSYDYTNLGATANNNFKGMIIAPFDGTLDAVIVSTKGINLDASNTGDVTVYAYKNQDNFSSSTDVVVAHDAFTQKASGTPNIYSGIFDIGLAVSIGDLIQLKVGKSAGSSTDTIITVILTEN